VFNKSNFFFDKILCFVILIFSLEGCAALQPVRVGLTAELSGKQSELSLNLRNGVQMAVEELNAAGGINGRKIELLAEDDFGNPAGAQKAENKLVDSGVVAVIGHLTSNQTLAGYEVTQSRGVLLFSATASTSLLSGKKDLFFRTVAATDAMGRGMAQYIHNQRGFSKIGIIYDQDNNTYSDPLVEAFSQTLNRLGGNVTALVKFSGAEKTVFSALVDGLKSSNPECVFIIASPANTALIAQAIRLKSWDTALFSSSWGQGESLIQDGGKAVEGLELLIGFDVNDPSPELQAFKKNYEKRFARPAVFSAMEGYETMQMLTVALKKTAGEAKGLPEGLLALRDFQGLTGTIHMDEYGDAVRPLTIQKVGAGKFETIEKVKLDP
jgi:branched-chain amino acid transport system substrate-binding protein